MPPKHGPDGTAISTGMFFHDGLFTSRSGGILIAVALS